MLPECKFRPGIGHCGQRAWYTATVPLPLSVGVILARAEGRWYRSTQQMLEDADLLVLNVKRFYLEKNPINQDAGRISEFLRGAIIDGDGGTASQAAPTVGRRQLLSTVGEARNTGGQPDGDVLGTRVAVRVSVPNGGMADSQDLPGSGDRDSRRQTRSHTQPLEAEVQHSDRSHRRHARIASDGYDSGGEEMTEWGRRTTRARTNGGTAADEKHRRPSSRKRSRTAGSDSEADWEEEDAMSDESLLDEQENAGRRRGRTSKRSRR